MKLSPDDDDRLWRESEETPWFRFSTPLRYIVFLILLIGLLVGLWYLIAPSHHWYNKADIALIRADETPYKIKAENLEVPSVKHQDKLVYGRIRADQNGPIAEHILPDPEAPLPQIKEETETIKMVEQYHPEDGDPDNVVEDFLQEKAEEGRSKFTAIEDLIEEHSEENSTGKKTSIQLGSLKSYGIAESEWKRLLNKHPDVLGGLQPVIQKVDLGEEQGIYYRLRTGPFDGTEKAIAACGSLKTQKTECVIVP